MRVPKPIVELWKLLVQFLLAGVLVTAGIVIMFVAGRVGGPDPHVPIHVTINVPSFELAPESVTELTGWQGTAIRYVYSTGTWIRRATVPHWGFWTVVATLTLLLALLRERSQRATT